MREKLVIQISHAGLGDHLFLSPAPRIAKQVFGISKVYISNFSNFRNDEIKDLIWKRNPFVDGFIDEEGVVVPDVRVGSGENILDALLRAIGLDDGTVFHEPEIYYIPNIKHSCVDLVVYDPNYVSFVGFVSVSKIVSFFKKKRCEVNAQMLIRGKNFAIPGDRASLRALDLKDYCDIIFSCKEFYCLSSGSATLAAALGKKSFVFWGFRQKRIFHHSRLHEYVYVPAGFFEMIRYYFKKYVLGRPTDIR